MFSIKKSFVNCEECDLYGCPSCILETNCLDDLSKVEVVFVAENPGKDEVREGRPLVGSAGEVFRVPFNRYFANTYYLITNTALCLTVHPSTKRTINPEPHVSMFCSANCFNIIEACKPLLVVAMGTTPMRAFGIANAGITHFRGKAYKWRDYEVFLTVHPASLRYSNEFKEDFPKDFAEAKKLLIKRWQNCKMRKKDVGGLQMPCSEFLEMHFSLEHINNEISS